MNESLLVILSALFRLILKMIVTSGWYFYF
ncbi:hypothetical protein SAMN02744775_02892 [Enterobacter sp. CC120223-11]|nr:hypothetical protein SAMN02744775_02892 [Enterobacter sp. CC120223-11]